MLTQYLPDLTILLQVLLIDIMLAGDNAVVVGMAVAGLPARDKRRAIVFGIVGATVLRIALAGVALRLLAIVGMVLAGGILLLWVCWKMYRELRRRAALGHAADGAAGKTVRGAMMQIILADVSMSLDNVLAVAGAAHDHPWVLVAGLTISVVLMGVAAGLTARLLERHRWVAWIGLLIVFYVAGHMIWEGSHQVAASLNA